MKLAEQIARAAYEADTRTNWLRIKGSRRRVMTKAVEDMLASWRCDPVPPSPQPTPERVERIGYLLQKLARSTSPAVEIAINELAAIIAACEVRL